MSRFIFLSKLPTLVRKRVKINFEHAQEPDTPYTQCMVLDKKEMFIYR